MTFVFDRMELDDIGGKPRALALELHRQVRAQNGSVPLPVPLCDIAYSLGIEEITEREVDAFEGMLVAAADRSRGVIVLRAGLAKGRRAFTLGHEIGHYVNPYHRPPAGGFKCTKANMAADRQGAPWSSRTPQERMEVEANEFSATILFPEDEYRQHRARLSGCDLAHIEPLARLFGVSREAMARRYVATASETIAMLFSKDGRVRGLAAPAAFPHLGLRKGAPMPEACLTGSFVQSHAAGDASSVFEVQPHIWIEQPKQGTVLFEQTVVQIEGWAMTMLLVEEPDEDDEVEREEVERRWSEPQFSYRR